MPTPENQLQKLNGVCKSNDDDDNLQLSYSTLFLAFSDDCVSGVTLAKSQLI